MRSLREEAETGTYWRKLRLGAYWWKLRHELAGRKTARMLSGAECFSASVCILIWRECHAGMNSGGEIHPDLIEMSCRDEFQWRDSS